VKKVFVVKREKMDLKVCQVDKDHQELLAIVDKSVM
jgi:hypothetical protein